MQRRFQYLPARFCFSAAGNLNSTKHGFSKDVFELDITKNRIAVISTMKQGRDLRNKIALQEDRVLIMGGSSNTCEAFNYIDRKWSALKSYEKATKDSLDSWACAVFVNFPKVSGMHAPRMDYLSDAYSANDGYALNYYNDSGDDAELYDDMGMDMVSDLSMSHDSMY